VVDGDVAGLQRISNQGVFGTEADDAMEARGFAVDDVTQHDEVAFWCGEPLSSVGINGIEINQLSNGASLQAFSFGQHRDGFSTGGAGSSG